MRDDARTIGGIFVVGGVIGAVVALLYAPKSGKNTRKDISRTVRRVKNNTVDLIEETIEDVNEFAGDLKEAAADLLEHGAEMSSKARKELVSKIEHGQRAIEKQRRKLSEALGL